jgi:hypothetical protein
MINPVGEIMKVEDELEGAKLELDRITDPDEEYDTSREIAGLRIEAFVLRESLGLE